MNFLLNVDNIDKTQAIEGLNDKLFYGGRMLLIGMSTVFAVLIILWISLIVFKFFFHDLARANKKTKAVKTEQPAPIYNAPVASDNDEIIAVIAAAIAMAESECGSDKKFHVVSFKRK